MKKNFYLIIIVLIIILAIASIFLFYKNVPSGCPSVKYIDCMPIIGPANPESEFYCKPENRKWIEENCPDIIISE